MCSTGAMPSAPISPLATIVIFPARGAAFLWCWAGAPGRAADAWSGRNAPGFEQRFEPGLAAAESLPGCLHGPTGAHRQNLIGQPGARSEEHTSELQSRGHLVCRLLLQKKK